MKLRLLPVIALIAAFTGPAIADDSYPNKPVRVIVGYTAAGASDIIARLISIELAAMNNQPFVVDNKPGAGGMLGLNQVAKASPDGYTLGLAVSGQLVTGPHLVKNMQYDPLTAFSPISLTTNAPMVMLASPEFKFNTVSSIIKEAQARPDVLMYAAGAQAFDLAMRLFGSMAGIKLTSVPYPGGAQASMDVMAGRVPLMVDTIGAQQANIKAGKLTAVAVLDSKRSPILPGVQTAAEAGLPGYEVQAWNGIVAPKGTPEAIIKKLNKQLQLIMAMPEVKEKLSGLGFEPISSSPEEFSRLIASDYIKWGAVVKKAGMVAQ